MHPNVGKKKKNEYATAPNFPSYLLKVTCFSYRAKHSEQHESPLMPTARATLPGHNGLLLILPSRFKLSLQNLNIPPQKWQKLPCVCNDV